VVFVDCIHKEAQGWVKRVSAAKKGRWNNAVERSEIEWPVVPDDFLKFKEQKMKAAKKVGRKGGRKKD
jgi:hypothetical protein